MSTDKYRWMRWLPDPVKREDHQIKNRGLDDLAYELSIHAMSLPVNGTAWTFASNGAASLLMRGATLGWKQPSEEQAQTIRNLATVEIRGKLYPLADFRKWLGKGWKSALPCADCGSNWAKNCPACFGLGRHQVRCQACEDPHDCVCTNCINGILYCPSCVGDNGFTRRPGSYQGVVFDRALLARFLAHVETSQGARVKIMTDGATKPIWVESWDGDWRAAIAPLRDSEGATVPTW